MHLSSHFRFTLLVFVALSLVTRLPAKDPVILRAPIKLITDYLNLADAPALALDPTAKLKFREISESHIEALKQAEAAYDKVDRSGEIVDDTSFLTGAKTSVNDEDRLKAEGIKILRDSRQKIDEILSEDQRKKIKELWSSLHPSGASSKKKTTKQNAVEVGQPFPDFSGYAFENGQFPKTGGQISIVSTYATWAPPANAMIPILKQVARDYATRSIQVVGVSVADRTNRSKTLGLKKQNLSLPDYVIFNPVDDRLESILAAEVVPVTYIVGSDGILIQIIPGFPADADAKIRQKLDELVGARVVR